MLKNKSEESELESLRRALAEERELHRRTKIKLKMREHENHAITQSLSYKLAKVFAKSKHVVRKTLQAARYYNPVRLQKIAANRRYVERGYRSDDFVGAFEAEASSSTAVILHLYYTDMASFFKKKLRALNNVDYDLYITVTDKDRDSIGRIKKEFPHARVALVPNCGRDVLPFMQVLKHTQPKGYAMLLKMHSKKSPHREDGDEWRDKIIDSLLPSDRKQLAELLNVLGKKNTAIVGPEGEYVSMLVNYDATRHHTTRLARAALSEENMKKFLRHPDEYGFFAGTMFWARVDALTPFVSIIEPSQFEPEYGQQDSTLAHALERMMNVVAELNGKDLYELHDGKLVRVEYQSTNIPAWADYSIDDE